VVFHIVTQPDPGTGLRSLPPILRIESQATITAYSKGA
jgi:hypothetical protein